MIKLVSRNTIEFSLNSFHWILRIQWIMTKSKTGLVTRGSTHLTTDTLPVRVILRIFPLLPLVRYLLPLTTLNRYLTRDSNGNFFFTTARRNISVARYGLSLVTTLLLDLAKIHWIQWIQRKLFRQISNESPKYSVRWGNRQNQISFIWNSMMSPVYKLPQKKGQGWETKSGAAMTLIAICKIFQNHLVIQIW